MNIKKIILEEVSEFDWAKDIPSEPIPLTEENYEVGLIVRIAETSEYYKYKTIYNPKDTNGVIIDLVKEIDPDDDHVVWVQWPHDTNCYKYEDLVIVYHIP
jgi:hypothetical protein